MFREIANTRQHLGEPRRRWFAARDQDLYVWHDEAGRIIAFQLCYAKFRKERAIYWRADSGFAHLRVDDGEDPDQRSSTPILLADGAFDRARVVAAFRALAGGIPSEVVDFVLTRLAEYPADGETA